jgi:hypothetical protein
MLVLWELVECILTNNVADRGFQEPSYRLPAVEFVSSIVEARNKNSQGVLFG